MTPATRIDGYRPALRPEVRLLPGEPPVLGDPISRFRLRVDAPWERAILGLLVGQKTISEVCQALHDQGHAVEEPAVLAFCKSLRYLRLTKDTDPEALQRIRRALDDPMAVAARAQIRVLPSARFGCQTSGMCCRSNALGPLDAKDLETLERLPLLETFPALLDRPPLQQVRVDGGATPPADGAAHFFLNTRDDGACVFLQPDELCGLHARFGARAKPGFCRLFPREVVKTPTALYVIDHGGCSRYGAASTGGPPLGEEVAEQAELVRTAAGFGPVLHKTVALRPDLHLDLALFFPIELLAVRTVEEPFGTVGDAVATLKTLVEATAEAILTADDAVGTPETVLLGVAERRPLSLYAAPRDDRTAGLSRMAAALDRVAQIGRKAAEAAVTAPRGGAAVACRLEEATRAAELGAALCREEAASPRDGDAAVLAAVVGTFVDRGAVDARLRRLLRDLLFARRLGLSPTPALGVAYLAILLSVILAGARWQAAANGRRVPSDEDVDRAQFTTIQLLRFANVTEVLLTGEETAAVYAQLAVL